MKQGMSLAPIFLLPANQSLASMVLEYLQHEYTCDATVEYSTSSESQVRKASKVCTHNLSIFGATALTNSFFSEDTNTWWAFNSRLQMASGTTSNIGSFVEGVWFLPL